MRPLKPQDVVTRTFHGAEAGEIRGPHFKKQSHPLNKKFYRNLESVKWPGNNLTFKIANYTSKLPSTKVSKVSSLSRSLAPYDIFNTGWNLTSNILQVVIWHLTTYRLTWLWPRLWGSGRQSLNCHSLRFQEKLTLKSALTCSVVLIIFILTFLKQPTYRSEQRWSIFEQFWEACLCPCFLPGSKE